MVTNMGKVELNLLFTDKQDIHTFYFYFLNRHWADSTPKIFKPSIGGLATVALWCLPHGPPVFGSLWGWSLTKLNGNRQKGPIL